MSIKYLCITEEKEAVKIEKYMLAFWAVTFVALVIVEAMTAQLVTIWFAVGSLAALISQLFGAQVWVQWLVFVVVTSIVLAITRPLVKKYSRPKIQPTNADRCIGQTAVVTEEIDNLAGKGAVKVGGIVWTARSDTDEKISENEAVTVIKIDGVKLIVKKN